MQRLNDMPTSELIKTAHAYSGSIKEVGIYSELVKELTNRLDFSTTATSQALAERSELRREVTALDSSVTNLESKLLQLIGENAYLLPKAASELSNAWVLNKYWVGIHAALMHVRESRLHDGMVWLQNTVAGPGIEVPQLSEFAEIEAWAVEQQKDSISAARALEIIKAETPATDAALAEILNEARVEGIYFTANRMLAAWDAGFIDSPAKEVIDVAHMILSAADMLKDATEGDFSRKFADEIMAEMKPQLRKEQGK